MTNDNNRPFSNDDRFPNDEQYRNDERYPNDEQYRIQQDRQSRFETERIKRVLADIDQQSSLECSLNVAAQWNFETNVNEVTQVEAVSSTHSHEFHCRV